jgi:hypothetical protein
MAVPLLSHPFRLLPNGSIAARDDGSDEYLAERIALILITQPGERPLAPLFGINDAAFNSLDQQALEAQVSIFQIPVNIVDVTTDTITDSTINYTVQFTVVGDES